MPRDQAAVQIDNAFPPIDLQFKPLRRLVTVQFRTQRSRTMGGLIIPGDSQQDMWHDQVVRILAISDNTFCGRNVETGELVPYKEGPWFSVGDYVRVPKHGIDLMFHKLSETELTKINELSEEAKASGGGTYIANEGLYDKKTIKIGNLFFDEINGVVLDPLSILNAH